MTTRTQTKEEGKQSGTDKTGHSSAKSQDRTARWPERVREHPGPSSKEHPVVHLQRSHGNQAVQSLVRSGAIQAKRRVNGPGDRYEQEADRVAEQVTRISEPAVQRTCTCGNHTPAGGECSECSKKQRSRLQTKLRVNEPGDIYEQEADRIADQVMATPAHPGVSGTPPRIQRFSGQSTGQMDVAPASIDRVLASPGKPLEPALRQDMEQRFDHDFSNVRVHTGMAAEQSAQDVNAKAYTIGHDIVFGTGRFMPDMHAGRRLIAHELAHVVQQKNVRQSEQIQRAPEVGSGVTTKNPVLTPEELFEIIVRERAWTFNRGGTPAEDPDKRGRNVGPAAGGKRAGNAVFAVIQVTDKNGNPVALTYGEHIKYGAPHAEEGAVSALRRTVPKGADLTGGRMTVVLDQVPCPPGRQNCLGLLTSYARQHGLELDIRLPTRERVRGGGSVKPRTATMSSQRTDVPAWRLERYQPPGTVGPTGPGSGPGPSTGGGGRSLPAVVPKRQVPPAPPSIVQQRADIVSTMEQQTTRGVRFTSRLSTYVGVAGGLFNVLDVVSTVSDALKLASEGTVLGDAERAADQVVEQAREAKNWAEETYDSISLLTATALVSDAIERGDTDALFDLSSTYGDLADELRKPAEQFEELSRRFTAQAEALDMAKGVFEKLVDLPQPGGTISNAQAFAMFESLGRLSGRVKGAAAYFGEASTLLGFLQTYLSSLSYQANQEAWGLVAVDIVRAQAEIGRQQEAAARAERRIDVRLRIAENEARVAEPVSLPAEELEALHRERQQLLDELRTLGGP